jgi:hypothetical protein
MGHAPGLFGHIGQRGGLHEPDIVVGLRKFTLTDLAQQDVLFEIRRFLAGESIEGRKNLSAFWGVRLLPTLNQPQQTIRARNSHANLALSFGVTFFFQRAAAAARAFCLRSALVNFLAAALPPIAPNSRNRSRSRSSTVGFFFAIQLNAKRVSIKNQDASLHPLGRLRLRAPHLGRPRAGVRRSVRPRLFARRVSRPAQVPIRLTGNGRPRQMAKAKDNMGARLRKIIDRSRRECRMHSSHRFCEIYRTVCRMQRHRDE